MARSVPDVREQRQAVAATARLQKKRDAAPSWADHVSRFGEGGAVRNKRGAIVRYNLPKSDDPEKQRAINNAVYEMWGPHRRVSVEQGNENSARVPTVMVRDPRTGMTGLLPEATVERRARKQGWVEVPRRGTPTYRVTLHRDGTRSLEVRGKCVLCHAPDNIVKQYMSDNGLDRRLA